MSSCNGDFNLSISETKNIVEIETCVNSTGVNSVTIQNVSDTNLEINTNCVNPSHPTISAASSVDNDGSLFIQDILLDSYGHVTGISSAYATVVLVNKDAPIWLEEDRRLTVTASASGDLNIVCSYEEIS